MKKIFLSLLVLLVVLASSVSVFAHSGRTDSSGGHNDNKNASGLGSYHYHHGYGPHLHPNGICPYSVSFNLPSTPSSSDSGTVNSQSNSASSNSTAQTNSKADMTAAEKDILSKAKDSVQQAKNERSSSAVLTLTGEDELTLIIMQEISRVAKESNVSIILNSDIKEKSKVILRLGIDPSLATKKIKLGGYINNEEAETVKKKYESWYSNRVEVIALNQQDNFGMVVEIIAKVDLSNLKTDSLLFYSYDQANNTHVQISSDNCSLDENGYVHIKTSLAGYIIITDKKWVKK